MTEAMTEAASFELLSLECRVDGLGSLRYYNALGQLHREYGPAVLYASGCRAWYQNDLLHSLDGPAVEYANGDKRWYQNGDLHRTDGPAIEYASGTKRWYINGDHVTEAAFLASTQPAIEMTVAEVEKFLGNRVKIIK